MPAPDPDPEAAMGMRLPLQAPGIRGALRPSGDWHLSAFKRLRTPLRAPPPHRTRLESFFRRKVSIETLRKIFAIFLVQWMLEKVSNLGPRGRPGQPKKLGKMVAPKGVKNGAKWFPKGNRNQVFLDAQKLQNRLFPLCFG